MSTETSGRRCSQCPKRFPPRLPGSGIPADVCSVACQEAKLADRRQASAQRRQERQQTTREQLAGERESPPPVFSTLGKGKTDPLNKVFGRYEFPIPHGYDPHHWLEQTELRAYVRRLKLPTGEAIELLRDLLSDERNISVMVHSVHMDGHRSASSLFTREDVKPEAFVFATELGPDMLVRLERLYPLAREDAA